MQAIALGRIPAESRLSDGSAMCVIAVPSLDGRRMLGWYRRDRDDIFRSGTWWGDAEWIGSTKTVLTERPPVQVGPERFYHFGEIDGTVRPEHIVAAIVATVAGHADVMGLLGELPADRIGPIEPADTMVPEVAGRMLVTDDALTRVIRDHLGPDGWLTRREVDDIGSRALHEWCPTDGERCPFWTDHVTRILTRVTTPAPRYYSFTALQILHEAITTWPGCPGLCVHDREW
ncbi:hypothetical protein ABLE94_24390 [Gordonia sp. VNK1]|uniref:hypothetical protein n=1 Tax=Gordonia oleivorans TaxID=3156618 RepID=UPI0032B5A58A